MRMEIRIDDRGVFPTIGEGALSREEAHEFIQHQLNAYAAFDPALRDVADRWKNGAQDDTVYSGLYTWTIYEYEDDPVKGATLWLDGYVETMRSTGLNIAVHWPKN